MHTGNPQRRIHPSIIRRLEQTRIVGVSQAAPAVSIRRMTAVDSILVATALAKVIGRLIHKICG